MSAVCVVDRERLLSAISIIAVARRLSLRSDGMRPGRLICPVCDMDARGAAGRRQYDCPNGHRGDTIAMISRVRNVSAGEAWAILEEMVASEAVEGVEL